MMTKYYYQHGKPVGIIWEDNGNDDALFWAITGAIVTTIVLTGVYIFRKK